MTASSREQVEAALSAAAIWPERRAAARAARLTGPERALYHWILRRFAAGNAPGADALFAEAVRHGLESDRALSAFAAEDLVHTDERGEIAVAYSFSMKDKGNDLEAQIERFFASNDYETTRNVILVGRSGGRHEIDVLAKKSDGITDFSVMAQPLAPSRTVCLPSPPQAG